jgi:hypothetical protein
MSDASVRGIVHVKEETKTYGSNGFRKRLVVLEQDKGKFTNYIPVDFTNDDCDSIDDLNVGDEIEITYRLSGRKWQRDPSSEVKYFLNAEALSFNVMGTKSAPPPSEDANESFAEAAVDEDEIPF